MTDYDSSVRTLLQFLGPPTRYAFKERPLLLYVKTEDNFKIVKAHSVDFEIACDLRNVDDAKTADCIYNPHLINIIEPGLNGDEINCYTSHSIMLDNSNYNRLLKYSNREGCRGYTGVVNGYSVRDIKDFFGRTDLDDTGVCLVEKFVEAGGLSRPEISFNETAHKRFVQASESYKIKSQKLIRRGELIPKRETYTPLIQKLIYMNQYEYDYDYAY